MSQAKEELVLVTGASALAKQASAKSKSTQLIKYDAASTLESTLVDAGIKTRHAAINFLKKNPALIGSMIQLHPEYFKIFASIRMLSTAPGCKNIFKYVIENNILL